MRQILIALPRKIAPETVVFAGNDIVAFEGVSPNVQESELVDLLQAVKATFARVKVWRFTNEFGVPEYFWQAGKTSLPLSAFSDTKVTYAQAPLKEPQWAEFRSPQSQYAHAKSHKA